MEKKAYTVKCPNCGATFDLSDNISSVECQYCHTNVLIDDNSIDINLKMENAEEIGYNLEKGRLHAISEEHDRLSKEISNKVKKQRIIKLLKWVLFFPVLIPYNIVFNRKLDFETKFIALFIIFMIILIISNR